MSPLSRCTATLANRPERNSKSSGTAPPWNSRLEGVLGALAAKPRVLFVCNPNNPTGTLQKKSVIENVLQTRHPDTAVVLDEAYAEFSGVTVIPLVNQYPQLFVARTFLKPRGSRAFDSAPSSPALNRSPSFAAPPLLFPST